MLFNILSRFHSKLGVFYTLASLTFIWSWYNCDVGTQLLQFLLQNKSLSYNLATNDKALLITLGVGDYWYKPLVKANRANYCAIHGYQCFFVEEIEREESVAIQWAKIAEVKRYLRRESLYKWILLTDVDSFIMNLNLSIPKLIDYAFSGSGLILNNKYFKLSNNLTSLTSETFDIMVSVDNDDINVGTILIRNTNFSRYFINEMWMRRKDKSIPKVKGWPEQSVFIYLCRMWPRLMNQHVAIVHQKVFNSYSTLNEGRRSPHHIFKSGEFLIHFPGIYKDSIRTFTSQLFRVQPELLSVASQHNITLEE